MISLSVVVLCLAMAFGGAYLVYKMNKTESLKTSHHGRRHPPKT